MKYYLIDTNVVIDMLLDREGADAACKIFDGAEKGDYELCISSLSFTNIYYSLRKILSHQERISCLMQLQEVLVVLSVNAEIINSALRSNWTDFEDAVQYYTAVSNSQITAIITRNVKDFRMSQLPVINSLHF